MKGKPNKALEIKIKLGLILIILYRIATNSTIHSEDIPIESNNSSETLSSKPHLAEDNPPSSNEAPSLLRDPKELISLANQFYTKFTKRETN